MVHRDFDDVKDRVVSALLGVLFIIAWLGLPLFQGVGDSELAASPLFYLVWTAFFLGGSLYLLWEAAHAHRSDRHGSKHSQQRPRHG